MFRRGLAISVLVLCALASPQTARADAVVGSGTPGSCTESAFNAALAVGGTITFACGFDPVTIGLTTPKTITGSVTLDGDNLITLSGGDAIRPFTIGAGASLTLQTIVVEAGASAIDGGCLYNGGGTLQLVDATVQACTATRDGGGIFNAAGGTSSLLRSTVQDCTAGRDCGAVCDYGASLTMSTSRLSTNTATTGNGGGIGYLVAGSRMLSSMTLEDNHAGTNGGSVYTIASLTIDDALVQSSTAVLGAGLYNAAGTATVTSASFFGNTAALEGGGVYNASGATFNVDGGVFGSEISGNMAVSAGMTTTGGGLHNAGTATVTNMLLDGNSATNGGGIANAAGTLGLAGDTLSNNMATGGSGGGLNNSASATVTNCTFSMNGATAGGALLQAAGATTLTNVTCAQDTATTGGTIDVTGGTATLRNSILAAGAGGNCAGAAVTSTGFNVVSDGTCALAGPSDANTTPPLLGALKDNGGLTPTYLPLAGSPAIDKATGGGCPATDQRGLPRPSGSACDTGSVEIQQSGTTTTSTSTSSSTSSSTSISTSSSTSTSHSTTTSTSSSTSTSHSTTTSTSSSSSTSSSTSTSTTKPTTSSTSTSSSSSTTTSHSTTSTIAPTTTTSTTQPGATTSTSTSSSTTTSHSTTSTIAPTTTTSTTQPGATTSTSTSSSTSTSHSTTSTTQPGATTSTSTTQPGATTSTSSTSTTQPGATTSTSTSSTSSTMVTTTSVVTPTSVPTTTSTVTTTSIAGPTTTLAIGTATTTTLPDPCALVASGPSFDSIECRLDDLGVAMRALGDVTPRAPALRDRLDQARELERGARERCQGGDKRRTKKALKSALRKLGNVRAVLASKASKGIPGRDDLVGQVAALRNDVRSLRGAVACPTDASVAAGQ